MSLRGRGECMETSSKVTHYLSLSVESQRCDSQSPKSGHSTQNPSRESMSEMAMFQAGLPGPDS